MLNPAAQSFFNLIAMWPSFHYAMVAPLSPLPRSPLGVPVCVMWADNLDLEHVLQDFARRVYYVAFIVHYPSIVHGATGQDHNMLTT